MPRLPLPAMLLAATGLLAGTATIPAALLPASAGAATGLPAEAACPAQASAVIDALYRWLVAPQQSSGPLDLSSQRQLFTPFLYERLSRALALQPADGRFVDFDVFSGTQVGLFGARVQGCSFAAAGGLEARVAVTVGITSRGPEATPQILRYRLVPGSVEGWRIADITYTGEPDFKLSTYLSELLDATR